MLEKVISVHLLHSLKTLRIRRWIKSVISCSKLLFVSFVSLWGTRRSLSAIGGRKLSRRISILTYIGLSLTQILLIELLVCRGERIQGSWASAFFAIIEHASLKRWYIRGLHSSLPTTSWSLWTLVTPWCNILIVEIGDLFELIMLLKLALDPLVLWNSTHLIRSQCPTWHSRSICLSESTILTAIQGLPRFYRITVKHGSLLVIVKLSTEQRLLLLNTIWRKNLCCRYALRFWSPSVLLVSYSSRKIRRTIATILDQRWWLLKEWLLSTWSFL